MPVDLSIKQVPDELAERLRARARRHHRSLQGELRAILEWATADAAGPLHANERAPAYGRGLDLASGRVIAPRSESALMIREDRDGRTLTVRDLFDHVSSLGGGTPDESAAWIRQLRSSR
jgi:plasmid stability protein